MDNVLRWIKFETMMIALFFVKGISAPKINRISKNHLRILEYSL